MDRLSDLELQQKFKDYEEKRRDTKKTIENYASALNVFREWLNLQNLTFLHVQDMNDKAIVERFLQHLQTERKKANGESLSFARTKVIFSALNSFYDFLEYEGYAKKNIILLVRKRFLKEYKNDYVPAQRKVIDVETMSKFLNSIVNLRDKSICVVFVKTGIRINELINLDITDIDLLEGKIKLKERMFKKRSNTVVPIDDEAIKILKQWIQKRKLITTPSEKALFIGERGRLNRHGIETAVLKWTTRFGLHDPTSPKLEERFTCHAFRHCTTTFLADNGMDREYIKELRGDKRGEVIDIYRHINFDALRRAYLSCMPKFGLY